MKIHLLLFLSIFFIQKGMCAPKSAPLIIDPSISFNSAEELISHHIGLTQKYLGQLESQCKTALQENFLKYHSILQLRGNSLQLGLKNSKPNFYQWLEAFSENPENELGAWQKRLSGICNCSGRLNLNHRRHVAYWDGHEIRLTGFRKPGLDKDGKFNFHVRQLIIEFDKWKNWIPNTPSSCGDLVTANATHETLVQDLQLYKKAHQSLKKIDDYLLHSANSPAKSKYNPKNDVAFLQTLKLPRTVLAEDKHKKILDLIASTLKLLVQ